MMNSLVSYKLLVGVVLFVSLAILFPRSTSAQSAAARPDRGFTTGASYSVSDIENISLTNGNVNVSIPLAGLPPMAGGKLNLTVNASYNSKLWNVVRRQEDYPDLQWQPYTVDEPQLSDLGGWRIGGGYRIQTREVFQDSHYMVPPANSGVPEWDRQLMMLGWFKVVLRTPDGAERELRPTGYSAYNGTQDFLRGWFNIFPNGSNYIKYYSFDGTYVTALIKSDFDWTLFMPDGTQVVQTPDGIQRIKDTNGNSIKIFSDANGTHYQDEQTGREVRVTSDPAGNGGLGQSQVHYQTVGGTWMTVTINWGITTVQGKAYATNSWLPFGGEFGEGAPCTYHQLFATDIPVVREIVYPVTEPGQPARRYSFSYNSDTTENVTIPLFKESCSAPYAPLNVTQSVGWGALSEVITPSGAKAKYSYVLDSDEVSTLLSIDAIAEESILKKELIYDSPSVTDEWTYGISSSGGGTVTHPDNSVTSEAAYAHSPGFAYSNGRAGLVYRSTRPGIVTERHWTALVFSGGVTDSPNGIVSFNPVVDAEYTTLVEGNPAQPVKMSAKTFQHDYNGNVTAVTEYDWFDPSLVSRDAEGVPTGVPGSATVLRTTNTSYYNPAGSAGSGNVYAVRSLTSGVPSIINATQETITGPAKARFSYDGQPWGSPPTAGNLTRKSVWNNVANDWINTDHTYGLYGNLASTTDGRLNVITYGYANPPLGLPTHVTVDPENGTGTQTTTTTYDTSTGLVISTTDPNGNISTIDYVNQLLGTVDPFGRPGVVIGPDIGGGVNHLTKTFYADASRTVTTHADLNTEGDGLLKSQTISDMLGRVIESRQYENANDFIAVRKSYNNQTRLSRTSNPFRAGESVVWTTTVSDAIGRVVSVATPDNAVVGTNYYANTTTVTDQAGKQRKSVTDGLGRLIQVYEAPNDGNYNYLTSYTYDSLDNLTTVNQGSQTRTFGYDSLKRLVSASNPESGPICYGAVVSGQCQNNGYDNNGNLVIKTDARGVRTNFVYDALNRLTNRSYENDPANTPAVAYVYDTLTPNGKGRLTSVSSTVSSYNYSGYDAMGRVAGASQLIGAQTYTITDIGYDLAGHLRTMKYPSGRTITNTFDGAGRLSSFTGNLGDGTTRTYSTGILYSALGGRAKEQFGTNTPLFNKSFYNSRGQLAEIRVSTSYTGPTDTTWNRGAIINNYSYQCWGMCGGPNSTTAMTDNNGNLRKQEVYIPADDQVSSYVMRWQEYDYDSLNRLRWVREISGANEIWRQTNLYDRYGNRTIDYNGTTPGIPRPQFAVSTSNNRLGVPSGQSGTMSYDAAGNLTVDTYSGAAVSRIYDAENKMTKETQAGSVDAGIYSYDGDGRRVKRNVNGIETWQVYGIGGELLVEYAASAAPASPQKEYGYRNGELLITADVPTANRTNVARASNGATATASSNYPPSGSFAPSPAGAIDGEHRGGNYLTTGAWHSSTPTVPQWLQVDFNGSKTIDEISVFSLHDNYSNPPEPTEATTFSLYGLTAFDVQYWNGSSWVTVPGGTVTGNNKVWKKITFPAITTSKIRVVINATADGWSRVVEVQAWGQSAAGSSGTNVALATNGGVASASTAHTCCGFSVGGAINGNINGPWGNGEGWNDATENALPDWFQVDFAGSKTINEIDVFSLHDDYTQPNTPTETQTFSLYGLVNFDVQYWNGSAWVTIPGGNVTGNNKVWRKFTFAPLTTSKIRLWITSVPDGWSRLVEIRAWQTTGSETYQASTQFSSTQGQNNWYYVDENNALMTYDATNNVWQGSEGPYQWLWASGGHPGGAHDSVRQWRAPSAGSIRITGNASDGHPACGDGVVVVIKKGTTVLWQQTVANGNTTGVNFDLTTSVSSGDQISFVINRNGDPYCDSTGFDPTITFSSGGGGSPAQVRWLVADHLGTPRMVFDQTGDLTVLDQNGNYLRGVIRHDYLPFGEELYAGINGRSTGQGYTSSDNVRQKFTSKERDNETGLDYFIARYYSWTQGRFTSPDKPFADQFQANPQSWNTYSYVRNSPCNNVDAKGRCSAPSGLKPGQVGICIEAFIAAKTFRTFGAGNDRTFNGNDEKLTSKFRVDIIAERTPGNSKNLNITQKTKAGDSYAVEPLTGVQISPAVQGTANSKLNSTQGSIGAPAMSAYDPNGATSMTVPIDKSGNASFNVTTKAENGLADLLDQGSIRSSLNLSVNANNGQVTLGEGSKATGYPSFAIYSYVYDGKNIVTTTIKEIPETKPEALKEPMKRIP